MEIWERLSKFKVFEGIDLNDIKALNFCFKSHYKIVDKHEIVLNAGDRNDYCVFVLTGKLSSVNYDYFGSETIIKTYSNGEIYGVEEAYLQINEASNTLIASEKSEILLFNKYRFLKPCENNCPRHRTLTKNITNIMAKQNLELTNKINILSKRSTREKVLEYLKQVSRFNHSRYFDIPYNRSELASFLAVDRSALSIELSKMKKDGLIDFSKNHFQLK